MIIKWKIYNIDSLSKKVKILKLLSLLIFNDYVFYKRILKLHIFLNIFFIIWFLFFIENENSIVIIF